MNATVVMEVWPKAIHDLFHGLIKASYEDNESIEIDKEAWDVTAFRYNERHNILGVEFWSGYCFMTFEFNEREELNVLFWPDCKLIEMEDRLIPGGLTPDDLCFYTLGIRYHPQTKKNQSDWKAILLRCSEDTLEYPTPEQTALFAEMVSELVRRADSTLYKKFRFEELFRYVAELDTAKKGFLLMKAATNAYRDKMIEKWDALVGC